VPVKIEVRNVKDRKDWAEGVNGVKNQSGQWEGPGGGGSLMGALYIRYPLVNMYCLFVYCLFLLMKVLGSGLHQNKGLHKAEFKHRAKDSSRLLVFMCGNG